MALSIKKQRWHVRRWFLKLSKLQRSVLISLPFIFAILMIGTTFALASKTKADNQSDVLPIETTNNPEVLQQTQQPSSTNSPQPDGRPQSSQNKPPTPAPQTAQSGSSQSSDFSIALNRTQVSFSRATASEAINATATNQVSAEWTVTEPTGGIVVDSISVAQGQQSTAATFTLRANNAGNFTVTIRAIAGNKTVESTVSVTVIEENFDFSLTNAVAQDGVLSLQLAINSTPGITSFSGSGIDLNKCGLSAGIGNFSANSGTISFTYDVNQAPQNCIIEVNVSGGGISKTAEYTFVF